NPLKLARDFRHLLRCRSSQTRSTRWRMARSWRRLIWLGLSAVALALVAAGCGSSGGGGNKLTLAAYSTPKEAYAQIIPAFQKTAAGKGVSFDQSYGAPGEQERPVAGG